MKNSVIIAETMLLEHGKCDCLQKRSYPFSLDGYFKQLSGECRDNERNGTVRYGRYAVG